MRILQKRTKVTKKERDGGRVFDKDRLVGEGLFISWNSPAAGGKFLRLLCLFAAITAGSAFGQTPGKLVLKSGAVMEYLDARVEGNDVVLKLAHGAMRMPVAAISEESLLRIGGSPAVATVAPQPTASLPPTPAVPAGLPQPAVSEQVMAEPASPPPPPVAADSSAQGEPRPDLWKHLPRALTVRPDSVARSKTKLIEFEVSGKLFENPKAKVQCLVPLGEDGRPAPGAEDVVFYAPYQNQKDPVVTDKFVKDIAEIYGMTVFSLNFKTAPANFEDLEKCYYYAESGSYEMVLEAWDKVVSRLQIPRKNLLIAANSAGSTMAQRFALLHAGKIDAVAMLGGWRYEPMTEKNDIAWSVLCTRGDIREEANFELAAQARTLGVNMLSAITPLSVTKKEDFAGQAGITFHHVGSVSAFDISHYFLATIRDLRKANKNWRDYAKWPLRVPAGCQWAVEKNEGAEGGVRVPSAEFAEVWLRNENRYVTIPVGDGESRQVHVRYPKGQTPRGIIIYGGGGTELIGRGDDMDFLGLLGFIVVSIPESSGGNTAEGAALFEWVTSLEQWRSYPVFLLGFNEAGRNYLELSASSAAARVRGVAAIDASFGGAENVFPKPGQIVLFASLDGVEAEPEGFQAYRQAAEKAGASVASVAVAPGSRLPRFDLLEQIAGRFTQ
jgi:pimeloyl-ACP methyl ester carboxylesterase